MNHYNILSNQLFKIKILIIIKIIKSYVWINPVGCKWCTHHVRQPACERRKNSGIECQDIKKNAWESLKTNGNGPGDAEERQTT